MGKKKPSKKWPGPQAQKKHFQLAAEPRPNGQNLWTTLPWGLGKTLHKVFQEGTKAGGGEGAHLANLAVGKHGAQACGKVGNTAEGGHGGAHMVGGQGLINSGHADGLRAQQAQHAYFGRRLIGGARHHRINTLMQRNTGGLGRLAHTLEEVWAIEVRQVQKARPQAFVVGARQRVGAGEVKVVHNGHKVSRLHLGPHASGGICQHEGLNAQAAEDARRKSGTPRGNPLIGMRTALHGNNGYAAQVAKHQLPRMALYGGEGEVGYVRIGQCKGGLQALHQHTQAATEYKPYAGGGGLGEESL